MIYYSGTCKRANSLTTLKQSVGTEMRFFKLATLLKNFRTSLNNCFKIMGKTGGAYWKEGAFIDGCAHEVFLEQSVTLFRLKVILKAFYLLKQ